MIPPTPAFWHQQLQHLHQQQQQQCLQLFLQQQEQFLLQELALIRNSNMCTKRKVRLCLNDRVDTVAHCAVRRQVQEMMVGNEPHDNHQQQQQHDELVLRESKARRLTSMLKAEPVVVIRGVPTLDALHRAWVLSILRRASVDFEKKRGGVGKQKPKSHP